MITCKTCLIPKPEFDFYLDHGKPKIICKNCINNNRRETRKPLTAKQLARHRELFHLHRRLNPDYYRARDAEKSLRCNQKHRADRAAYSREYYAAHTELCRERNKKWHAANLDRRKISRRNNYRKRRKVDPMFAIVINLRNRLQKVITRDQKSATTMKLVGCSKQSLKIYLESRFQPGMSWQNYGQGKGKWQIDHEIPCAIFDLSRPDHQLRCFHFSNLVPMWASENISKRDKILLGGVS